MPPRASKPHRKPVIRTADQTAKKLTTLYDSDWALTESALAKAFDKSVLDSRRFLAELNKFAKLGTPFPQALSLISQQREERVDELGGPGSRFPSKTWLSTDVSGAMARLNSSDIAISKGDARKRKRDEEAAQDRPRRAASKQSNNAEHRGNKGDAQDDEDGIQDGKIDRERERDGNDDPKAVVAVRPEAMRRQPGRPRKHPGTTPNEEDHAGHAHDDEMLDEPGAGEQHEDYVGPSYDKRHALGDGENESDEGNTLASIEVGRSAAPDMNDYTDEAVNDFQFDIIGDMSHTTSHGEPPLTPISASTPYKHRRISDKIEFTNTGIVFMHKRRKQENEHEIGRWEDILVGEEAKLSGFTKEKAAQEDQVSTNRTRLDRLSARLKQLQQRLQDVDLWEEISEDSEGGEEGMPKLTSLQPMLRQAIEVCTKKLDRVNSAYQQARTDMQKLEQRCAKAEALRDEAASSLKQWEAFTAMHDTAWAEIEKHMPALNAPMPNFED